MGEQEKTRGFRFGKACTGAWLVLFIALFVVTSTPARAANRQARERQARKACLVGDFAKGVAILSDLFLDTKDPNYIYNQGRCFEQNHRYEDAISRFEEYLRVNTKLEANDKSDTEKHIGDCQRLLAKQRGQEPPTLAVAPQVPQGPSVVGQPAAAPAYAPANGYFGPPSYVSAPGYATATAPPYAPGPAIVGQPVTSRSDGGGLRSAGIITASAGGALLITGLVLNLKANAMADDMETKLGYYTPSVESDRRTYATLGWIGYGTGTAAIATGVVLYVLGHYRGASSSSVAVIPDLSSEHAGAYLTGAF